MSAYQEFDPTSFLRNQTPADSRGAEKPEAAVATFATCARPAPTAEEWRKVYAAQCDRVMLRRDVTLAQAAPVAWERTVSLWHIKHGAKPPASTCAACGRFSPDSIQALPDGALVCDDECLIAYGARWQAASVEALRALGVEPVAVEPGAASSGASCADTPSARHQDYRCPHGQQDSDDCPDCRH